MISTTGVHAIRALTALAQLPDEMYAGTAAIAGQISAPPNYLGKLLQLLAREGLVASQKGMGGGFRLARRPETISLLDVIGPIEGITRWSGCILGQGKCDEDNHCSIHDQWKGVRAAYLELLTSTTIADLVAKGEVSLHLG